VARYGEGGMGAASPAIARAASEAGAILATDVEVGTFSNFHASR
jgi:phytoene dehydrogenase-like protein